MEFRELVKRVLNTHHQFPREWDKKSQYINLVEEVGESGNAILLELKEKPEKRRRAYLKDSFADLLFAQIVTADAFDIDLEKELLDTLEAIEKRLKKGECVDE